MIESQPRLVGPFQQLVLLAVIRIGPDCHGGAVHRYIEARTGRWVSLKAVYTTLQRLEYRGYIGSWSRPPAGSRWLPDWRRPGPVTLVRAARRLYSVRTLGRRALRLTLLATDRMQAGLPGLFREAALYSERDRTRSPRRLPFRDPRLEALCGTWALSDPRWCDPETWGAIQRALSGDPELPVRGSAAGGGDVGGAERQ